MHFVGTTRQVVGLVADLAATRFCLPLHDWCASQRSNRSAEIADYTARLADAKRLAALGPWKRYLERNPGMATGESQPNSC